MFVVVVFLLFYFFFFVIIIVHVLLFCISCLLYDRNLKRARRQSNERGTAVVAFDFWYFGGHHGNSVGHRRQLPPMPSIILHPDQVCK